MDHELLDLANADDEIGQVELPGVSLVDAGLPAGDPREMFHSLAGYLVAAGHLPSRDALMKVASAPSSQWGRASRSTALIELADLAGVLTVSDADLRNRTVVELTRIFRETNAAQDDELAEAAAWAIGCWDLTTLMSLRSEANAFVPLCRFSSEKAYLIYESFYVCPDGVTVDLPTSRPRIFVVMPIVQASDFVETFFSHLVTWGFTNNVVDPANCIGGIIVAPYRVTSPTCPRTSCTL